MRWERQLEKQSTKRFCMEKCKNANGNCNLSLATQAPDGYPATGRKWEDLSTTHVITGKQTSGVKLFQELYESGVIDNDYDTERLCGYE